ncbi:MAG TPA: RES family NAD+ phosphorylase [Gammaproteobacteria bacterium]|nr:RES family NAD+ phosphorylase [Gammaproteobacteria bacterium]
MAIWHEIQGVDYLCRHETFVWRIVEDQSKSTTRKFVDSLEEHEVLENLIEASKPKLTITPKESSDLHYLLSTPFRYPPLRWGSRFGTRFDRGILYGSLDLPTAMCEKAYHRLAFLTASEGDLGGKTTYYTSFQFKAQSNTFVNLIQNPFNTYQDLITSKKSYDFTQALGSQMRTAQVDFFLYPSARTKELGQNIGIFSPKAILHNRQISRTFQSLHCYATKEMVEFSLTHRKEKIHQFPIADFLVDGVIPIPPLA